MGAKLQAIDKDACDGNALVKLTFAMRRIHQPQMALVKIAHGRYQGFVLHISQLLVQGFDGVNDFH